MVRRPSPSATVRGGSHSLDSPASPSSLARNEPHSTVSLPTTPDSMVRHRLIPSAADRTRGTAPRTLGSLRSWRTWILTMLSLAAGALLIGRVSFDRAANRQAEDDLWALATRKKTEETPGTGGLIADPTGITARLLWRLLQTASSSLTPQDLAAFNGLFRNARIRLPNEKLVQKVVFNEFILDVSNIICYNVRLDKVAMTIVNTSPSSSPLDLDVSLQVSLDCDMDYWYGFGSLRGSGSLVARTQRNALDSTLRIAPGSSAGATPSIVLGECAAQVNIADLDFRGGVVARIADTLSSMVARIVQNQVSRLICDQLSGLGSGALEDAIADLNQRMQPYLTAVIPPNPLLVEQARPVGPNILSFRAQSGLGSLLSIAIRQLDAFLAGRVSDAAAPTGTGTDLALNVMLRDRLLDEDRAWNVNITSLMNPVILDRSDKVTDTDIRVDAVRVYGLDSIQELSGLDVVGDRTIQSLLQWDFVSVHMDLTVSMRPSSRNDAIIEGSIEGQEIVEKISVALGVDDFSLAVSLMTAIDNTKLGDMKLGSLLFSDRIVPCLLSSLDELTVAALNVSISNIREPTLEGFVSPGVDHIISQLAKAALAAYEPTLLRAVPGFFHVLVRDMINQDFIPSALSSATCKPPDVVDESVDLRDLLLAPQDAKSLGASGNQQYGDLGHLLYQAVKDTFLASDGDGTMGINKMLIRPMTANQSGVEGVLQFDSKLLSLEETAVETLAADRFELSLSGLRVENVDAFRAPLLLLEPSATPFETNNYVRVGSASDRVMASMRLLIALFGERSPLSMYNELNVSAAINFGSIEAALHTVLASEKFQNFPLRQIMDFNCWLSTFAPSVDGKQSFRIISLATTLASLTLNATCVTCTSQGTVVLPDLIEFVSNAKAFPILARGLERAVESYSEDGQMNLQLAKMVEDSRERCAMNPGYDSSAAESQWTLQLSGLPLQTIDAVILGAILMVEAGLTVFTLGHEAKHEFKEALSAQQSSNLSSDIKLLDWTDLESSLGIGKLPDSLYEEVRNFFAQSDDTGKLRINSLLENSVLEAGVLEIVPAVSAQVGGMTLSLDKIAVAGLDSFSLFELLEPIAPQSVQNRIQLDSLGVQAILTIGSIGGETQQVSMSFNVTDLAIDLAVFAAFDLNKMGSVTLESFFGLTSIVPCLLSTAHAFDIPRFIVNVGSFSRPIIEGLLPASSASVASFIDDVADAFGARMATALPYLFDSTIRELLVASVNAWMASKSSCSTTPEPSERATFVDFRDLFLSPERARELGGTGLAPYGILFRRLYDMLEQRLLKIDPSSGLAELNGMLVTRITEMQSGKAGRLEFPDPFNTNTRINVGGLDATVQIRIFDAYIDNVASIGDPLSLFSPVLNSASELNNTVTIGVGPPLIVGGRFLFGLTGDDMDIENDIAISFSFADLSMILNALIQVDETSFRQFTLKNALNQYCWLATIPSNPLDARGVRLENTEPSLAIQDIFAKTEIVKVSIDCMNCSSPGMFDLAEIIATPEATGGVTTSINNFLDYVSSLLGGAYLQTTFDRLLVESRRRCLRGEEYNATEASVEYAPFSTPEPESSFALFLSLALSIAVIAFVVWILVLFVRFVVRRRHRKWLREQSTNMIQGLWREQCEKQIREEYLNAATSSLFRSSNISLWVRVFIPICIVGNIGLFLSGHLSLGATVTIVATVGEQTVRAANFYEFSIARSTVEIWKAGGKALSMLILIVSGIWPYTKQLVTLALWFAPTQRVSVSTRGSIFLWFDVLAKWSFVDIFVLIVTVAGFRVSVQSPEVNFLPREFYSLDLLVVPMWGLYANMLAQIVSQISSHFIIHYHRNELNVAERARIHDKTNLKTLETGLTGAESGSMNRSEEDSDDLSRDVNSGMKEALHSHAFQRPHRQEGERLTVRWGVNYALILLAGLISILILLGCALPVISQEVLGIIGIMVESGQDFSSASENYSLFTIIRMLFNQAGFTGRAADYIGLGSLSIILILTVLIIPIVQTCALLYQWFQPMSQKSRSRWSIANECLEAWQYCEVFILAVVVAAWQLGPVSEFMVGSSCASLTDTFAQLAYYGILKPEDAQCFRVDSLVASGSFVLAAGALLLILLRVFVKMAEDQYARDHEEMESSLEDDESLDWNADTIDRIVPTPVLFSDRFRWLLVGERTAFGSLAASSFESRESDLGFASVQPCEWSVDAWQEQSLSPATTQET